MLLSCEIKACTLDSLPPGQPLYSQGQTADAMYFLLHGRLHETITLNGLNFPARTFEVGDSFGVKYKLLSSTCDYPILLNILRMLIFRGG